MEEIMAVALSSMHQDMSRLEHVGTNLTNAATPGYKREVVAAQTFSDWLHAPNASVHTQKSTMDGLNVVIDAKPGTLKATGQSLDLALSSTGFFEVQTDNGPAYTRAGNFQVDAQGRLTTAQGYPVMGKGGIIHLTSSHPVISITGAITEEGQRTAMISQVKVVQFDELKSLRHIGNGLMMSDAVATPLREEEVQVHQGYLEGANVSSSQEMIQLMQSMRHFESMQRVVQGYDELLGVAIHKLGDL